MLAKRDAKTCQFEFRRPESISNLEAKLTRILPMQKKSGRNLSLPHRYAAIRISVDLKSHARMPAERLKQTFPCLFKIRVWGVGFEPYRRWRRLPQIPLLSPGLKIISAYYKRPSSASLSVIIYPTVR